jgi:L-arabinokinase
MKTCVFFVSGHGFGHASREVEVINALAAGGRGPRVIVRSDVAPDLLTRTVTVPYELRPGACDPGIVQSSSVSHDDEATVRAALAFYSTFDDRIVAETAALAHDEVALIVGDIPPLAFEVASQLSVPGVAIGNFSWSWIYEDNDLFMREAAPLVPRMREAYAKATLALELPFAGGFDVFPNVRRVPLIARRSTRDRRSTRTHFRLPLDRRVALLSFGGYGLSALDLNRLDCLDTYTIATTDRSAPGAPAREHAVMVSEDAFRGFRYEDLVAAVDVVVTKPGYGIIAECIASGTAMLYTSRGDFREYDLLVSQFPAYVKSSFISQDDLFAGRWRASLEKLVAQPAPARRMAIDGTEVIAQLLREVMRD